MNAMTMVDPRRRPVGELLREWRERRRLSQLDLAIQADISTRHLSFVETGRSRPTPEMILRLTDAATAATLRQARHPRPAEGASRSSGGDHVVLPDVRSS